MKVRRALVSVHDKTGVVDFARDLARLGVEILSTGGTAKLLRESGVPVRDISEVLVELGLPEMKHRLDRTVTYHDACHLAHAQKVTTAPRQLLSQIPGVKVVSLPESDMCCGAAGTYNLTQPAMATDLAARKLSNITATGCTTCAAGNVGCAMHIQSQADARGQALDVVHPVELIHDAVFGPSGNHS